MSNSKVNVPSLGRADAGSHGRRLLTRRVSEGLFVDVNSFKTTMPSTTLIGGMSLGTNPLLVASSSSSNVNGEVTHGNVKDDIITEAGCDITQTNDTDIEELLDASVHDEDPEIKKLSNEFKNMSVSLGGQTKITNFFHRCYKSKTDCKKQGVVKSIFKTARGKTLDGFKRLSQVNNDKPGTDSMAAFSQ